MKGGPVGRLEGKVAFITGAARGQGRAHAVRMAEEGADIIAVDLCGQIDSVLYAMASEADLEETAGLVTALGRGIVHRRADVRRRGELESSLKDGLSEFGRLDIVVANAGILASLGDQAFTTEAWHDSIDVMLTGVFNTVEVCVPRMVEQGEGGSIVITSSTAGLSSPIHTADVATPGFLGYAAAKHGVVGLMRSYASAFANSSIRVNTIHPTGVRTPMVAHEHFAAWAQQHPENVSRVHNALPVQVVEPEDIANAAVWLCSDEARYVTGVTLPVDAGYLIY
jgi:SDR family mycofactocin-dependent oxidoreductase